MGINCGIVGLPNVGKSTIFNALTSSQSAEAANYPFCTIEPNTGVVAVPDERLNKLGIINKSVKIIPTSVEFVDIAGLVKGASEGEGLGNKFLGHIRAVDAIVHIVRCFEDENVTHVEGSVNPKRDVELIETELLLSDLESAEKRLDKTSKGLKSGDKAILEEYELLKIAKQSLDKGILLSTLDEETRIGLKKLGFLTAKPVLFVGNVSEDDLNNSSPFYQTLLEVAKERGAPCVKLSGKVESEISQLEGDDRLEFLEALGLKESGLERLSQAAYELLGLLTFFTSGPKETRAWTIVKSSNAVDAAGEIHSDFAKGFIRAEIISYNDFITFGGELGAKEKGKLRSEGKTYIMEDGDVVHFRFNV
jgi:GTP-binding protein YchF